MKKITITSIAIALIFVLGFTDHYKANSPLSPKVFNSTLDSLSGTWISSIDSDSKIVISGRTHYFYYENQPEDTLQIFIADDCTNHSLISSYDVNKSDGGYLVLYKSGDTDISFCYKIEYLSATSLELIYDGKKLSFDKQ